MSSVFQKNKEKQKKILVLIRALSGIVLGIVKPIQYVKDGTGEAKFGRFKNMKSTIAHSGSRILNN